MKLIHRHFPSLDSTNDCAKRNRHLFEKEALTCITADMQTKGRGRQQRTWISPAHQNIYASFCFFIDKHFPYIGNIGQLLAISAGLTLEQLEFHPKLKWPNDLLLNGRKVGGILTEVVDQGNHFLVVAGIGLNINMPSLELEKIGHPATSLMTEKGNPLDLKNIESMLIENFHTALQAFLKEGFTPFLPTFKRLLSCAVGEPLQFTYQGDVILGTFDSIAENGSLNLQLQEGKVKNFISGELG